MSVRLLREIHARLMEGVRGRDRDPGELRRVQNWIGPAGASIAEATFIPPPPQLVPDALSDLERFLHADDSLPDLLKIGLAHAQFETIHPFLDGNGRLGRLLITFLLCERELLREPVLYLSHYLNRHRSEYYDRLQAVHDDGDWERWLGFFLEGVERVASDAAEVSRHVVDLRERHRGLVVQNFGGRAANALKVLEHLFRRPLIKVKEAQDLTGVSYQAANQLIGRFEEHGILTEFTGQRRNRRFRYAEYIDLFGGRE